MAADAARAARVELWEHLPHGWYLFANTVAEASATYRRIGELLRDLMPR